MNLLFMSAGSIYNMKVYLKIVEVAIEHDGKFLIIKRPEGKNA
jgi:hypothetical protein